MQMMMMMKKKIHLIYNLKYIFCGYRPFQIIDEQLTQGYIPESNFQKSYKREDHIAFSCYLNYLLPVDTFLFINYYKILFEICINLMIIMSGCRLGRNFFFHLKEKEEKIEVSNLTVCADKFFNISVSLRNYTRFFSHFLFHMLCRPNLHSFLKYSSIKEVSAELSMNYYQLLTIIDVN